MGGLVGGIVVALVGGFIAVLGGFFLVNSQTAVPAAVDAPYITYGQR